MMANRHPLCQVAGCHHRTARAVEVDIPAAWEGSATFTTVTVVAGLCRDHGHEVARRVEATLQARTEFHDLLSIITAAVGYERGMQEQLERAAAEIERLELELGASRQQLRDTEAELRLARALRGLDQRRVVARALDEALNTGDGVYRP